MRVLYLAGFDPRREHRPKEADDKIFEASAIGSVHGFGRPDLSPPTLRFADEKCGGSHLLPFLLLQGPK